MSLMFITKINKTMRNTVLLLISVFLITACHRSASDQSRLLGVDKTEMVPVTRQSTESPPPPPADTDLKNETHNKMIIKDGEMGLKVDDLEQSRININTLVASHNGYFANEGLINSDYESAYHLKIRLPSVSFEKFIAEVESGEGEVTFKNIQARDVTAEFIDLETRLSSKHEYLKKYNDLLKQAKSVNDILEIEEKARIIQEEIESSEGRLRYLSDQVSLSTLDLTLTKEKVFKYHPAKRDNFVERLKQSLTSGWLGFVDFVIFLIKLWPFWIIVAMGGWLFRKIRLRIKSKKDRDLNGMN